MKYERVPVMGNNHEKAFASGEDTQEHSRNVVSYEQYDLRLVEQSINPRYIFKIRICGATFLLPVRSSQPVFQ